MSEREKKMKAAIAGVMQYISEEQKLGHVEPIPINNPTNWSFYSRQVIMLNRNQIQRRLAKR